MEAESRRPGKLAKINETAAALAINDYIAGKRSKENLEQTLAGKERLIDYQIDKSLEATQLKGGSKNWMSDLTKEAASQKGSVTDVKVIKSVLFKGTGKPVTIISKPKKSLAAIDTEKDLKVGFNIITTKDGRVIYEKLEDGTVRPRLDLPIT